jgi:Leucine-rich repeat (LRR) protein
VLESLDLRDNQFKALPNLAAFTALQCLEVSYNEVRYKSSTLSQNDTAVG